MRSKSQPDQKVFFLDRCLGKEHVATRLRAAGLRVEVHADHFPETERSPERGDQDWLKEIGHRGWIILSKDQNIHRNQIEIIGLLSSGAPSFVLTAGGINASEMADCFIKAMPQIINLVDRKKAPFVASVTKLGYVRLLFTFADLVKRA